MFIQTESTPNPNTMKFLPGQAVMPEGVAEYTTREQAGDSPLAQALFSIDGVSGVFLGSDFITVTRQPEARWDILKAEILTTIMEHYVAGLPAIHPSGAGRNDMAAQESDSDIIKQIKELIETRVRPAVAQDGGDIIYRGFDDGIVKLQMRGACSGCPSSTATLKHGIENMLRHYVPEVTGVEAVMD